MSSTGFHERHLTSEEILARVFPVHEGAVPVPLHLSVCAECQAKVARLREAWLMDRGAVQGAVDAIPAAAWEAQRQEVLGRVRDEAASAPSAFPLRWTARAVRRPAVAAASLAAALLLVGGISILRPRTPAPASAPAAVAAVPTGTANAASRDLVNAADVRDDELLRGVDESLSKELPFRALIPEEV